MLEEPGVRSLTNQQVSNFALYMDSAKLSQEQASAAAGFRPKPKGAQPQDVGLASNIVQQTIAVRSTLILLEFVFFGFYNGLLEGRRAAGSSTVRILPQLLVTSQNPVWGAHPCSGSLLAQMLDVAPAVFNPLRTLEIDWYFLGFQMCCLLPPLLLIVFPRLRHDPRTLWAQSICHRLLPAVFGAAHAWRMLATGSRVVPLSLQHTLRKHSRRMLWWHATWLSTVYWVPLRYQMWLGPAQAAATLAMTIFTDLALHNTILITPAQILVYTLAMWPLHLLLSSAQERGLARAIGASYPPPPPATPATTPTVASATLTSTSAPPTGLTSQQLAEGLCAAARSLSEAAALEIVQGGGVAPGREPARSTNVIVNATVIHRKHGRAPEHVEEEEGVRMEAARGQHARAGGRSVLYHSQNKHTMAAVKVWSHPGSYEEYTSAIKPHLSAHIRGCLKAAGRALCSLTVTCMPGCVLVVVRAVFGFAPAPHFQGEVGSEVGESSSSELEDAVAVGFQAGARQASPFQYYQQGAGAGTDAVLRESAAVSATGLQPGSGDPGAELGPIMAGRSQAAIHSGCVGGRSAEVLAEALTRALARPGRMRFSDEGASARQGGNRAAAAAAAATASPVSTTTSGIRGAGAGIGGDGSGSGGGGGGGGIVWDEAEPRITSQVILNSSEAPQLPVELVGLEPPCLAFPGMSDLNDTHHTGAGTSNASSCITATVRVAAPTFVRAALLGADGVVVWEEVVELQAGVQEFTVDAATALAASDDASGAAASAAARGGSSGGGGVEVLNLVLTPPPHEPLNIVASSGTLHLVYADVLVLVAEPKVQGEVIQLWTMMVEEVMQAHTALASTLGHASCTDDRLAAMAAAWQLHFQPLMSDIALLAQSGRTKLVLGADDDAAGPVASVADTRAMLRVVASAAGVITALCDEAGLPALKELVGGLMEGTGVLPGSSGTAAKGTTGTAVTSKAPAPTPSAHASDVSSLTATTIITTTTGSSLGVGSASGQDHGAPRVRGNSGTGKNKGRKGAGGSSSSATTALHKATLEAHHATGAKYTQACNAHLSDPGLGAYTPAHVAPSPEGTALPAHTPPHTHPFVRRGTLKPSAPQPTQSSPSPKRTGSAKAGHKALAAMIPVCLTGFPKSDQERQYRAWVAHRQRRGADMVSGIISAVTLGWRVWSCGLGMEICLVVVPLLCQAMWLAACTLPHVMAPPHKLAAVRTQAQVSSGLATEALMHAAATTGCTPQPASALAAAATHRGKAVSPAVTLAYLAVRAALMRVSVPTALVVVTLCHLALLPSLPAAVVAGEGQGMGAPAAWLAAAAILAAGWCASVALCVALDAYGRLQFQREATQPGGEAE